MSETKKKSGKPSNVELLAERKEIAELLIGFDADTNRDRVLMAIEKIGELTVKVGRLTGELGDMRVAAVRAAPDYVTLQAALNPPPIQPIPAPHFYQDGTPLNPVDAHVVRAMENGDGLQPMSSASTRGIPQPGDPPEKVQTEPIDRAHYPAPGEASSRVNTQRVDSGPEQATSLGDLTPGYARWFCSTNGPEATRRKYENRTQHLPHDVREAIR